MCSPPPLPNLLANLTNRKDFSTKKAPGNEWKYNKFSFFLGGGGKNQSDIPSLHTQNRKVPLRVRKLVQKASDNAKTFHTCLILTGLEHLSRMLRVPSPLWWWWLCHPPRDHCPAPNAAGLPGDLGHPKVCLIPASPAPLLHHLLHQVLTEHAQEFVLL